MVSINRCDPDLHDADGLHDQFDPVGRVSHGLNQGNVVLFQCVQGRDGRIQSRHSNGQLGFTFILNMTKKLHKINTEDNKKKTNISV